VILKKFGEQKLELFNLLALDKNLIRFEYAAPLMEEGHIMRTMRKIGADEAIGVARDALPRIGDDTQVVKIEGLTIVEVDRQEEVDKIVAWKHVTEMYHTHVQEQKQLG
jgi:hypothetical protein